MPSSRGDFGPEPASMPSVADPSFGTGVPKRSERRRMSFRCRRWKTRGMLIKTPLQCSNTPDCGGGDGRAGEEIDEIMTPLRRTRQDQNGVQNQGNEE